jgi:hypothetical protein
MKTIKETLKMAITGYMDFCSLCNIPCNKCSFIFCDICIDGNISEYDDTLQPIYQYLLDNVTDWDDIEAMRAMVLSQLTDAQKEKAGIK